MDVNCRCAVASDVPCDCVRPFASAAWELLKVDLQDTDAALRVGPWGVD